MFEDTVKMSLLMADCSKFLSYFIQLKSISRRRVNNAPSLQRRQKRGPSPHGRKGNGTLDENGKEKKLRS